MNDNFKKMLKELIRAELEEMTVSGGGGTAGPAGAVDSTSPRIRTPAWVSKHKKGRPDSAKLSMPGGKVVGEDADLGDTADGRAYEKAPIVRRTLAEGRGRYYNLREYPMKNRSKVCYLIQEVNKMLKEIEFITDLNMRLKKESQVGPDMYWKRTNEHFKNINERMRRVSRKLEYLKR